MRTDKQEQVAAVTDLGPATPESYRETRRKLLLAADRLTQRIRRLEPIRTEEAMDLVLRLDRERELVIGMIAGCSYVIDWLETGRRPGNRRGLERRAGYQREIPTDPSRLPAIAVRPGSFGREAEAEADADGPEPKRLRLEAALRGLTERERECYVLAHGHGYPYSEIAELLQISKSSVGTYIVRAQRKIEGNVHGPLAVIGRCRTIAT